MSWSNVTIEGDVLTQPELRYTVSGAAVTTFRISAGRRSRCQQGDWEDAECWVEVACFGPIAEHVAESLRTGDRAVVVGRLSRRSWQSEDGSGTKLTVRAMDVAASLWRATTSIARSGDAPDSEPLRCNT